MENEKILVPIVIVPHINTLLLRRTEKVVEWVFILSAFDFLAVRNTFQGFMEFISSKKFKAKHQ